MNAESAVLNVRFSAVLAAPAACWLGFEDKLVEAGCSVRRVSSSAAAIEALDGADLVVLAPGAGLSEADVLQVIGKAVEIRVLVLASTNDFAIEAARRGASVFVGSSVELAVAQMRHQLAFVDLRRTLQHGAATPTSGIAVRSFGARAAAPSSKEATAEALGALVEAAETLVPMHKLQRVYVDYALRRLGGNKVHTAAALGIDRRTIQRWARAQPGGAGDAPTGGTVSTLEGGARAAELGSDARGRADTANVRSMDSRT